MQINFTLTDNVRLLRLSCNAKKVQKQIQNYLKGAETIVVLIVFNGVPSDVRTYILLPSFTVALHESGTWESFIRSITR